MEGLSKNKIIQSIAGFAILILISTFIIPRFFSDRNSGQIDKELVKASSQWNMQAPLFINNHIRIDNHTALVGKNIQGSVIFPYMTKNDITNELLNKQKAELIYLVKTDPLMHTYREKEVTITYLCRDMSGNHIGEIKLTPDMYN